MTRLHLAAAFALLAVPAQAETALQYLNLPADVCAKRGELLTLLGAKGFTVDDYRDLSGGRRQSYYVHKTLGYNIPVMFFRGTDNTLSVGDCSIIFADSDPGIFPPVQPVWK